MFQNHFFLGEKTMHVPKRVLTTLIFVYFTILQNSSFAAGNLNNIFNADMIGANTTYLEKITGPARNTFTYRKNVIISTYKVDGCEITVREFNKKILSLGIDKLSRKCTFNLNAFLPNVGHGKLPPLYTMTFGQFDAFTGEGKYTSDCITLCGNAYDPLVYENWQASSADQRFELQLGVVLVSDEVLDATDKWRSSMVKGEGEDWVSGTKFNCSNKYDSVARKAFKNIKITSATIGFDLIDQDCKP
jgi:hypothetical protein